DGGFRNPPAVTQKTNVLSATPTYTNTNVNVTPYNGNLASATQPGGVITTDDSRLLNAEWRNNRLVTTHSVRGGDGAAKTAWYEFGTAGGTPTRTQEGLVN